MSSATAECIIHGGPILTMEPAQPRVEAIAIAGGRIVAVGSLGEVMAHAGSATRQVDLAGRTLLPGFIDAHGHFANALQVVGWANIQRPPAGPVTSIASLQQVLREHVVRHPVGKGKWVIAYGYDVDGLSDGRQLDKADLDPLFPENPVMVIHNSNHGAVLNSRALAMTGYDASTPDPAGGVIVRQPAADRSHRGQHHPGPGRQHLHPRSGRHRAADGLFSAIASGAAAC
ncbi:MAG: amidohydrolase family protein [Cyanobacteriota bacterium]|nr:amidohydrolase family protein [Cyanobacteriota bacterium]